MAVKTPPTGTPREAYSAVKLVFDDGREETYRADRPSTLLAFEREHGRSPSESATDVFRLCFIAAGHPGGTSEDDFDAWVGTIDEFEPASMERPTKASRGSSEA